MAKTKTPETIITEQVIEALKYSGYTVKKIYNGGVPATVRESQIIYKKKPEEYKGIPDLLAYNVRKGRFLFIEMKRKDGKVKPEQREFIDSFNSCKSFDAIVIRDFDEIKKYL